MGYKDIVMIEHTYPAGVTTGLNTSESGITANHVLINDAFPPDIPEDTNWTTASGTMSISFANSFTLQSAIKVLYVLGVPEQ